MATVGTLATAKLPAAGPRKPIPAKEPAVAGAAVAGAAVARKPEPAAPSPKAEPRPRNFFESIGEFLGNLLFGKSDLPTDGDASHIHITAQDRSGKDPVVFVNGAGANMAKSVEGADGLSERLGRNVQLIHNATEGREFPDPIRNLIFPLVGFLFGDVRQVRDDHLGVGHDPAVDAVRDTVLERLRAGKPIELAGHSQGNQTIAAGLKKAYEIRGKELLGDEAELAREFGKVKVLNISGPVRRQDYPPHVQYEHAELPGDPVSRYVGELSDDRRDAEYESRLYKAVFELGGAGGAHDPFNVLADGSDNLKRAKTFLAA